MRRYDRSTGYFGPAPMRCSCCGKQERQSGCLRGFACNCSPFVHCFRCHKCHTHCACKQGPASWEQWRKEIGKPLTYLLAGDEE